MFVVLVVYGSPVFIFFHFHFSIFFVNLDVCKHLLLLLQLESLTSSEVINKARVFSSFSFLPFHSSHLTLPLETYFIPRNPSNSLILTPIIFFKKKSIFHLLSNHFFPSIFMLLSIMGSNVSSREMLPFSSFGNRVIADVIAEDEVA